MNSVRVWIERHRALALAGAAAASLVLVNASSAEAARRKSGGYNPPSASIVVDAKTGKVLDSDNADAIRHPASITKVMTLYLLFEQLEAGKVRLNTPFTISANAARQPPSKIGLPAGRTIEVEDAILALVTKSANDIAVAVAENIAGSEEAFAQRMTRKARQLGMSRTLYRNASGLPDSEQVTTARDLSILGRAIQDRFPKYYGYFNTRVFNFAGASMRNHNRLLGRVEGVDGIKTGFINASGFNVLTNVKTDNRHVVAVVLGGRSASARDNTMAQLIGQNLPRAYAGARTAPPIIDGPSRDVMVADASPTPLLPVRIAPAEAVAEAPPPPARKPLDLNTLRPVVASAAGASGTTTPSSGVRWQKGAQPLPLNAQAYAALQEADEISEREKLALAAKIEARASASPQAAPVKTASLAATAPEASAPSKPEPRPAVSAWVIQLGATDDEGKAQDILDRAGKNLPKASPFTEKVTVKGNTLYRARFSGFDGSSDAQNACKTLKKSGFNCFAARG